MKTSKQLVNYCKAQVGLPYWYGCQGQIASRELLNQKRRQYSGFYTAKDFPEQYGKRVHDCSGLIKGCVTGGQYNPNYDINAAGMYAAAKEKGKISTMEKQPGVLVFKGSSPAKIHHVGVYIGGGKVIEAKGHKWGVIESELDESWTYWCKCSFIDYRKENIPVNLVVTKIKPARYIDRKLAGKYKVTSKGLNMRSGAGTDNEVVKVLRHKDKVQCYGYYSKSNGKKWLLVESDGQTGYCSSTYLEEVK